MFAFLYLHVLSLPYVREILSCSLRSSCPLLQATPCWVSQGMKGSFHDQSSEYTYFYFFLIIMAALSNQFSFFYLLSSFTMIQKLFILLTQTSLSLRFSLSDIFACIWQIYIHMLFHILTTDTDKRTTTKSLPLLSLLQSELCILLDVLVKKTW